MATENVHPHYRFPNGDLVRKSSVDAALQLINRLAQGSELVYLTDEELFSKGDEVQAVYRFYKKYDTTLVEAKAAIKHLRGEDL